MFKSTIDDLAERYAALSPTQRVELLDRMSAVGAGSDKTPVSQNSNTIFAAGNSAVNDREGHFLRTIHATASRYGIQLRPKMDVYEIDLAFSKMKNPPDVITKLSFKSMLARAGIID
jgi:hypothetical protein